MLTKTLNLFVVVSSWNNRLDAKSRHAVLSSINNIQLNALRAFKMIFERVKLTKQLYYDSDSYYSS